MANKSGDRGRRGENFFLSRLRELFAPDYTGPDELHPINRRRLQGVKDYGDFTGVPWLHESKDSLKPSFLRWAREATAKAGDDWVVMYKGDARTQDGKPLVLMPWAKYAELIRRMQ